jgi:SHS2 domain-containing protein
MAEWKEIEDHTADAGIIVMADYLNELLVEAASAFSELTSDDFTNVGGTIAHEVTIEEHSADFLLHAFLNEVLYLFDSKHFLANTYIRPRVIETPDSYVFTVTLRGGTFVREQHECGMEVKAITWHNLVCEKIEEGADEQWYAEVIFDI